MRELPAPSSGCPLQAGQRVMAQRYWSTERYEAVYLGPGKPILSPGATRGPKPPPTPSSRVQFPDGAVMDVASDLIEALI